MQNVRGRLLGYRENAREVELYGLARRQPRPYNIHDRRFPERQVMTSKPPTIWDNYD